MFKWKWWLMLSAHRLVTWVKDGPQPKDGLLGAIFGVWLHWRTWALVLAIVTGFVAVGWLVSEFGGTGTAYWAYLIGILIGGELPKLSAKYDVTKNF